MIDRTAGLEGKVALVTGAGRGQGRSHALALARSGVAVVACDVPGKMISTTYSLGTQEDLDETVRLIEAEGGRALGLAVDVRDRDSVEAAVATAQEVFGRLDILLANAGIVAIGPLAEADDDTWDETLATNLTGVFYCLRAVLPAMRAQQWGRIVITSSMAGRLGIPNLGVYGASKWGVIGLAKSLALEVADEGITVNVVCPCTVATPMILNDRMSRLFAPDLAPGEAEAILERFRRVNPVPEPWLETDDVTRAVMYLVSEPGVVTGTVMELGLGSSARLH